MALVYGSLIINTLAQYIDAMIIASISPRGLSDVGVYTLASFVATTIIVPQRSIIAATIPVLSLSWKKKDYHEINRIYNRTSINLLLLSLFIFCIIWLNVDQLFKVMNINKDYEAGKMVILLLGLSKLVDAGTGVNSQIIGTSNYWRFEMFSGILLLSISMPLNYILVKKYGINGSAMSNLIAFTIYNLVRMIFIYKKFSMQPFSIKTVYALISGIVVFILSYYSFQFVLGWSGIILRSGLFLILYSFAIISLKISPDFSHFYNKTFAQLDKFRKRL
jgi:O-antigen/teichoic acid export membrane protein